MRSILATPTQIMVKLIAGLFTFFIIASGCNKNSAVHQADTSGVTTAPVTTVPSTPPFDAKKVSVSYLPDSVRPFVSQHYPGYTIVAATYDPLCGDKPAIDVAIQQKGLPSYSVIFLPNGTYVQREEDVPLSTASAKIMMIIKQQYAGFKPGKQIERLTLADSTIEYAFDLLKSHVQKEVIFSPSGNVLCESKE